ncbi:MAG: efflux RND transporter periplasmic adaptor subunit [Clostridiales bacterium]|nr:efflux RND transporter periplasmic adaptor subunit [Clostridiales bacterium]
MMLFGKKKVKTEKAGITEAGVPAKQEGETAVDKEASPKGLAKFFKKKPGRRKKGGRKRLIFIGVLVIAAGVGGFLFWRKKSQQAAMATAMASASTTAQVTRGNLVSQLSSSGTIEAKDTYTITSLVEGEVIQADFEEGDQVEEGQILYLIDSSSMDSQMRQAQNSLERAQKNYDDAVEDYNDAVVDYSGNTYKSTRTGYIKELNIDVGDKVSSNTQLASIYDDTTMKIRVPFLSAEAAFIGVGNQAVITLEDTAEQLLGVVTAVANLDEVLSGGRMVRYVTVQVANPGGLSEDYTATVSVGDFLCAVEGSFEPVTDTTMVASMTGVSGSVEVEALLVSEGDYVAVGTPIFQISSEDVQDILDDFQDAIDNAESSVESAQSNLDSNQETYDNYTITAPISGEVISKDVKVGDKISRSGSSDTTLAVIYDLSELTFEMSVDELDIGSVEVGQSVTVNADAYEDMTFTGSVTKISLVGSQSNGVTNYPVTVTLDEEALDYLLPGMNVDGLITIGESNDTLLIPSGALMRGNRVYLKDDSVTESSGGVPAGYTAVEVEIGMSSDDYIEILSGLEEGDTVYVDESSTSTTDMFQMGGMGGGPGGDMGGGNMGGGNSGNRGNNGGGGNMGGGGGMR